MKSKKYDLKIKKPNFSGFLGFLKNLKNLGFLKWVSTALTGTKTRFPLYGYEQ